jgi:hypothetical protein
MDIIDHPNTVAQTGLNDPILTSLERYWRSLRHARHIPVRNDLNTNKRDSAQPHAFILQRVAPGTARFRVAGQRVHDMLKMDARGMPFSTLFHSEVREDIATLVETAFGEPAIIGMPLVSAGAFMRPKLHGAMLLLPMQDDKGETSRLLGAFVTPDIAQTRPRRFEINGNANIRHESLGLRLAATPLHHPVPVQSKRPDALQHPALRLVVNNG